MKFGVIERMAGKPEYEECVLVIGYGNPQRRDDGAGVELANRLAALWQAQGICVRLLTPMQLLPELSAEMAAEEVVGVVFVDASLTSAPGLEIQRVDMEGSSPSLGHFLDPSALLVYAALLYGRILRAWLVTIPGGDFDHGEGFSPRVCRLLEDAPLIAEKLVVEIQEANPCTNLRLPSR